MFQHKLTYVLMGVGVLSLLFALARTYWILDRERRERETPRRRSAPPRPPDPEPPPG